MSCSCENSNLLTRLTFFAPSVIPEKLNQGVGWGASERAFRRCIHLRHAILSYSEQTHLRGTIIAPYSLMKPDIFARRETPRRTLYAAIVAA